MNGFNRALAQLSQALRGTAHSSPSDTSNRQFQTESTPGWHANDHWQNLLACPMDARRYVLEDWSDTYASAADDVDESRIDSFSGRRVRHFN